MREFLKTLEKDYDTIKIEEEVSVNLEAAEFMKKNPKDTIVMENIRESDIKVVSGLCNTREKIARALNTDIPGITQRIMEAISNPLPLGECKSVQDTFTVSEAADLSKLPILTYYPRDGGPYITSGVIIAKDPETGVRNASIHRMLVLGKDKLTARIVPRHLYTYHQRQKPLINHWNWP